MRICLTLLTAASALLAATYASAETLYGSDDLRLYTFDSANAAGATKVSISGLQIGETLVGIDVRPATGVLFGVGSSNRVYTINTSTGLATQVAQPARLRLAEPGLASISIPFPIASEL